MEKFRQLLSRFDRPARWWAGFLALCLIGQFALLQSIGEKGRDAIQNRFEATEAKFETEKETFESEVDREKALWRSVRLREYVSTGLWYGAAFGAVVVGGLLLTVFWWGKSVDPNFTSVNLPSRRTWLLLFGIALIGLFIRVPRLDLSLYNDESFNFTRYIHGQFKHDPKTGEAKFRKQSWQQTLHGNHFGNNSVLFSALARLGHDRWQKSTGAVDGAVNETALRLPSLFAGSLSIVAIGVLGFLAFGTRGAVLASVLAALHPWHLRYSTEGRSYGLVILFCAIILIALILAIREGRWRWWILFGAAQFLCLWSYVGSAYFLMAANGAAFLWLLKANRPAIPKWIVANLLGAVAFIQVMAPSFPQIQNALASAETLKGYTGFAKTLEMFSYFLSGMPFYNLSPENPNSPAWSNLGMILGTGIFCAFVVFILEGLRRMFASKNGNGLFIAGVGLGAFLVAIILSNFRGSVLHPWYVIFALPAFIFLLAAAVEAAFSFKSRIAGITILLGFVAVFTMPFVAYQKQGKEQLKPLMLEVRGEVYPFESEAAREPLLAAFWSDIVYDPTIIFTPTLDHLKDAISRAENENRPLFVEFGFRPRALQHNPDLVDFIENSGKFELVKVFHGLEQTQFTHHLHRLKRTDPIGSANQ